MERGGLIVKFAESMGSSSEPTISHRMDTAQVSMFALGTWFHRIFSREGNYVLYPSFTIYLFFAKVHDYLRSAEISENSQTSGPT